MSESIEMVEMGVVKKVSQEADENAPLPFHAAVSRPVPNTWMYKRLKVGSLSLPHYASPQNQLFLIAIICLLQPGMYNANSGLGAGGQINSRVYDDSQSALYSTFSVGSFFSGSFTNRVGLRWTTVCGGLGYVMFSASLLCYNHTHNGSFVIFAGSFLGFSASLLWTAQGTIMLSYPPEDQKGRYISWFWSIFNSGAVFGSLVPLALNIHRDRDEPVSDGTYISLIALIGVGFLLCFSMLDAKDVVRSDGTWVTVCRHPTWQGEIIEIFRTLWRDSYVLLLFPMFFVSNWFYAYQFNGFNEAYFNTRTRALNNVLYWISQIMGAFAFGSSVDNPRFRRTTKAKFSLIMLFVLTMAVWGGGYSWQLRSPDRKHQQSAALPKIDWTDPGYGYSLALYMAYGFYDAIWQSCVYWFMGALTNSGRKTANFAGFYKGIQSAGAAIMWRLDGLGTAPMRELLSCWILLAGALVFAAPVVFFKITDHIPQEDEEDDSEEGNRLSHSAAPVGEDVTISTTTVDTHSATGYAFETVLDMDIGTHQNHPSGSLNHPAPSSSPRFKARRYSQFGGRTFREEYIRRGANKDNLAPARETRRDSQSLDNGLNATLGSSRRRSGRMTFLEALDLVDDGENSEQSETPGSTRPLH